MGQRDVDVKVKLSLVERIGQQASKTKSRVAGLTGSVGKLQKELDSVNKRRDTVRTLTQLNKKAAEAKDKWSGAQMRVRDMAAEMKKTGKATAMMKRRMEGAKREAHDAKAVYESKSRSIHDLTRANNIAAKSTRHLMLAERKAAAESERLQARLKSRMRMQNRLSTAGSWVKGKVSQGGAIARSGIRMARWPVAAGMGISGFAMRDLINTASDFETFQARLETATGSRGEANRSMKWIQRFTARTPFQLDETTNAFIKLRDRGLNPSDGTLRTVGDTASAKGKSLDQVVEAVLDAMTGDNERLKDLGIVARVKGNKTRYGYINKQGEQQYKIVDNQNQMVIKSTLEAIWNEKYQGQMDKRSSTWAGMWSNLLDEFVNFKLQVMDGGLFDYMKSQLGGLLAKIKQLNESGEMEAWAKSIGGNIQGFFEDAKSTALEVKKVFQDMRDIASDVATVFGAVKKFDRTLMRYNPHVLGAKTRMSLFGRDSVDKKSRDVVDSLWAKEAVPKGTASPSAQAELKGKIEVSVSVDSNGQAKVDKVTTSNPLLQLEAAMLNGSMVPAT